MTSLKLFVYGFQIGLYGEGGHTCTHLYIQIYIVYFGKGPSGTATSPDFMKLWFPGQFHTFCKFFFPLSQYYFKATTLRMALSFFRTKIAESIEFLVNTQTYVCVTWPSPQDASSLCSIHPFSKLRNRASKASSVHYRRRKALTFHYFSRQLTMKMWEWFTDARVRCSKGGNSETNRVPST